ncbi:MAG: DMT family transporter [Rhodobacteraceae bacterium]|nr:DMT family transporter [Paracoccaceae bacterium]
MADVTYPIAASDADRPLRGILFLLLATTLFPLQDVIIKSLSDGCAVHQIVFIRGVFALPIVATLAWADGAFRDFQLGSIWLQFLRAGTAFTSYLVYYMALASIGLAETAAITFSTPLFVTVPAAIFLGERIGFPRWFAVALGLTGVLIVVQPGSSVFEPAAVLALLAAVSYAVSIIVTRKIGSRINGGATTLFTVAFFILAGAVLGLIFARADAAGAHPSLAFLYRQWIWPAGGDWWLFVGLGCISGIGFFALTQAYRSAESSVVTPFEYTYLPWAVLWGYVFFGALPGTATWIGLAFIVGAGLFIIYRETSRGRKMVRHKGLGIMRQR